MPHPLTLAQLLAAATALTFARWGALCRCSTLDGLAWLALAVDPETLAPLTDVPHGAGASDVAAVRGIIDAIHARDVAAPEGAEVDARAGELARLAAEFPRGFVLGPDALAGATPAPDEDLDEGDARATGAAS